MQELCIIRSKPHYCQTHWFQIIFCGLAHHVGKRWLSFIARVVLSVRRSRTIAKHSGFKSFLLVGSSCWEEVTLFHCGSCAFSIGRSRAIAKHSGFKGFLLVGSSCWEEVTLVHCKSCAFSRSKPRYRQTQWFQRFLVGWLKIWGRSDSLSLQELCFQ